MPKKINVHDTAGFFRGDSRRSLFPLKCVSTFFKFGEEALRQFIYGQIFDKNNRAASFTACPVSYALKDDIHLRRVLVLDPISSFFLYDFVLKNSAAFQVTAESRRQHYGYGFEGVLPVNPLTQYHAFRRRKYQLKKELHNFAHIDIANCFNSFYHHDMVKFVETSTSLENSEHIGQFLREINAGNSVNCFPQGLYPAKTLGNFFLSFAEKSRMLKSSAIIRYLDDFYLFDNKEEVLRQDVLTLQYLLGEHALSLNAEKTKFGSKRDDFDERNLDSIKKGLVKKREEAFVYDMEEEAAEPELSSEEKDYLLSIIRQRNVAEEDIELAISLLRNNPEESLLLVPRVLKEYPHLIKSLHGMLRRLDDLGDTWTHIRERAKALVLSEYEVFWLVRIAIDIFVFDEETVDFLVEILAHPSATPVVRAAIFEMPELDHGMEDMKTAVIRNEPVGLPAIAAVAGLKNMPKGKRNQTYKYAAKNSLHMMILCNILSSL